jgi:hypothetical protein
MIDLKTIDENLAKAKADVTFWETAKALFLDPRIMQATSTKPTPPMAPPAAGQQPRPYGELKKKVLEALPEWGQPPVSTVMLVLQMEEAGYVFASKTPAISVNEALVGLEAEELAFMVEKRGVTRFWTKMQPKRQEVAKATP